MNALLAMAALCVAPDPEATEPIDVRSTIHVEGVVTDRQGTPVEGVEVALTFFPIGAAPGSDILDQTRSDEQGRFSVEGKKAERPDRLWMRRGSSLEQTLCLVKPGFAQTSISIKPEWLDGERARVELPEAEELPVRVLDPQGAPVAGAKVLTRVFLVSSNPWVEEEPRGYVVSKTDEQGRATLGGVKVEDLKFIIVRSDVHGDFHFPRPSWEERPDETILRMKPVGRLTGRVEGDDPEAGRNVSIRGFGSFLGPDNEVLKGARGTFEVKTDAQGRFEVPALAEGEYRVHALPRDGSINGESVRVKVEAGKTAEVALKMAGTVVVRGQVRDRESGRPLFGARVRMTTPGSRPSLRYIVTDQSGRFVASLPPGPVSVELHRAGEFCLPASRPQHLAEIPADARKFDLPVIEAVRGRRLTGRVVDEKGKPTGPGRVKALWIERAGTPQAHVQDADEAVDEHGRFTLHALPLDASCYVIAFTDRAASAWFSVVPRFDLGPMRLPFYPDLTMFAHVGPVKKFPPFGPVRLEPLGLQLPRDRVEVPAMGPVAIMTPGFQPVTFVPAGVDPPEVLPPGNQVPVIENLPEGAAVPVTPGEGDLPDQPPFYPNMVFDFNENDLVLPVSKDQLRSLDGRVVDAIGKPVTGATVTVTAEGVLLKELSEARPVVLSEKRPGPLTWSDSLRYYGPWNVTTDAEGRFETPRRLPAFLQLKVSVQRDEPKYRSTSSPWYAPTTPSFFDIEVPHVIQPDEQPVWDHIHLGRTAYHNAAFDEARGRWSEALDEADRRNPDDPLLRAYVRIGLAETNNQLNRHDAARTLFQEALDLRRQALGEDDPQTVEIHNDLAYTDLCLGHYRDALKEAKQVLIANVNNKDNEINRLWALQRTAGVMAKVEMIHDAENYYAKAQDLIEQIYGPNHAELAYILPHRAWALECLNRPAEAEWLVRRAITIADAHRFEHSPIYRPELAYMLEQHARILESLNQTAEAQQQATRARQLRALEKPPTVQ